MRWGVALLALLAAFGPWACGGAPTGDEGLDPGQAAGLDLADLEVRIVPYDLSGSTSEGLALLDAWLVLGPDRPAGFKLRADTLIDLWVYARVEAPLDDGEPRAAFEAVARALGVALPREWGAAEQASLSGHLSRQVAEDYGRAGASADESRLADALVRWAPAGAARPPEPLLTIGDDPRARLLLAARLSLNDGRRRGRPALSRARLADDAWLCDAEADDDTATLADRCGYWCAALPDTPEIGPAVERDVHEMAGDDTPVEFDDAPFEPQAYAAAVGADEPESRWFPTPGDTGYELVLACGADYFGLPDGGGLVLLNERNYLDLVYLGFAGDLLASLERDLLSGEPVVVLAANRVGAWADHYTRGGLAQDLTPAALEYDARLELPRWRSATPGSVVPDSEPAPETRLLLLRSDGISLALPPRLRLQVEEGRHAIVWAESEAGYHYPGREVVSLPRLNRLDDDQVSEDRIPILRRDLEDLERALARDATERRPVTSACGAPPGTGLAVLADGSTFFETLRPTLKTVVDCGYEPVDLVTLDPQGRAVLLPLELVTVPPAGTHEIVIENGRAGFRAASADPGSEVFRAAPDDEQPLLTIYRHLLSGLDDGTLDPQRPLLVTVADERVDAGMLATTLQLVLFRRNGEPMTEAELLSSPILLDSGGEPVPLFPAGVRINLR